MIVSGKFFVTSHFMKRLFEQMFQRPLNAFLWSAELLNRSVRGTQLIDGIVSRMIHMLSKSRERSPRE